MTDSQKVKWLEEIHIPAIRTSIEMGWLKMVELLVRTYRKVAIEHNRNDLIAVFDEFQEWIEEAKRHEDVYGEDSLFKRDHPVIIKAIKEASISVQAMKTRKPLHTKSILPMDLQIG